MIGDKDKYALVTGASSGIGYELAKLFARDGKNLVVVARSGDKLEALKKDIEGRHAAKVKALAKDLSDPKAPPEIFSELEREKIDIDVLVNNAGFAVSGRFCDTDSQRDLEMIQVNIASLTHLTKLFLKKMLENRSGKVMNVSSGVGWVSAPNMSTYAATKAYVLHFSEALAYELKGTGVSVTCLFPDATETAFWSRAGAKNTKAGRMKMISAATTAEVGYEALKKGKGFVLVGSLRNRLTPVLVRIAPRGMLLKGFGSVFEQA